MTMSLGNIAEQHLEDYPRGLGPVPQECEPVKRLFVAIPSYAGHPHHSSSAAIELLQLVLGKIGVELDQILYMAGDPYLDNVRNGLVTSFLESEATDLLFVDDDVAFEPNAVARICKARKPFIACIYPKKMDEETYPVDLMPGPQATDEFGHLEVKMAPTGFLRLNRAVFDVMPHVDYPCNSKTYRGHFWTQITPQGYIGEDVMFCGLWRALGGRIWAIPEVTLYHSGGKTWRGNLHEWLKRTHSPEATALAAE